jgi:hypothetical protein
LPRKARHSKRAQTSEVGDFNALPKHQGTNYARRRRESGSHTAGRRRRGGERAVPVYLRRRPARSAAGEVAKAIPQTRQRVLTPSGARLSLAAAALAAMLHVPRGSLLSFY